MQSLLMSKGRFMTLSTACYARWIHIQTFLIPKRIVNFVRTSKATITVWVSSLGSVVSSQQLSRRFQGLPLIGWAFGPGTSLPGSKGGQPMGCLNRTLLTSYEDPKEQPCIFRFNLRG